MKSFDIKIIGTINKVVEAESWDEAKKIADEKYSEGIWNMLEDDVDTSIEIYPEGVKKHTFDIDFLETFYEVVAAFYNKAETPILDIIENEKGRGGMWEYAQQLTDDFFALYPNVVWGEELDWYDTLEGFLKDQL